MLKELADRARKDGWASAHGSLDQAREEAPALGWVEVSIRRGDRSVTTLRPLERKDAKPNSLSARYGKDAQPLHTDGAHLAEPPDFVALVCVGVSAIPTLLVRNRLLLDCMEHGIFLVDNGKDSFFSVAHTGNRLRYDPGCMTPCDARGQKAAEYFQNLSKRVKEHAWSRPGTLLIVNNRNTLHARAAAHGEPDRELQRVCFRLKPAS